jgi:hypothetical protein
LAQVTPADLTGLMNAAGSPCVSVYLPTHRSFPDNQQDVIRYKNLVKSLEPALAGNGGRATLERLQGLASDGGFWKRRTEGLAVFADAGSVRTFDLQRTVPEFAAAAESFHVKPLMRILQSADRFQVLCLSRHWAKLFEGNRHTLDAVELTDVPATIEAALGAQLTEPYQGGYGGGPTGGGTVTYGQGAKKDEVDIDQTRFFRVIDKGILDHHSKPSGLPLILAALSDNQSHFRELSRNPHLLPEGINANPDSFNAEQLRAKAWEVFGPQYTDRLKKLVESYEVAWSRQQGSADLKQIAQAVAAGRVGTLLVEADRVIPGRLDLTTGEVFVAAPGDINADDLLDDLAEAVVRIKGEVVIVPKDRMPTDTGLAATFRY